MKKIIKRIRDAVTGQFTTADDAAARPRETVTERGMPTSHVPVGLPKIKSPRLTPAVPGVYSEEKARKPMTRFAFKDEDGKDVVIHVTGSRTYADSVQSMLINQGVRATLERLVMMDPSEMNTDEVDAHDRDVASRRPQDFYE